MPTNTWKTAAEPDGDRDARETRHGPAQLKRPPPQPKRAERPSRKKQNEAIHCTTGPNRPAVASFAFVFCVFCPQGMNNEWGPNAPPAVTAVLGLRMDDASSLMQYLPPGLDTLHTAFHTHPSHPVCVNQHRSTIVLHDVDGLPSSCTTTTARHGRSIQPDRHTVRQASCFIIQCCCRRCPWRPSRRTTTWPSATACWARSCCSRSAPRCPKSAYTIHRIGRACAAP